MAASPIAPAGARARPPWRRPRGHPRDAPDGARRPPCRLPLRCLLARGGPARGLGRAGRRGELGAHVPPNEVDEVRIIGGWLAAHQDAVQIPLHPAPDRERLQELVAEAARARAAQLNGSSTTSPVPPSAPTATADPGGASRRTRASAIGPSAGDTATLERTPTPRPSKVSSSPARAGAESLTPRR